MQAVLYTYQMEPITVVDLPMSVHQFKYDVFRIPVREEFDHIMYCDSNTAPPRHPQVFNIVNVRIEKLCRNGVTYPMFFVDEAELLNAFKLDAVPLVGQNRAFERRFQEGFSRGINACFSSSSGRY